MYKLKYANTLGEVDLSIGKLPVKELAFYGETEHRRLKVFHKKGTKCVTPGCDKVGTKLLVNEVFTRKQHKKIPGSGSIHVDIYTENNVMMTIDHIHPKSKGGAVLDMNNLQIMCTKCNSNKSDKIV